MTNTTLFLLGVCILITESFFCYKVWQSDRAICARLAAIKTEVEYRVPSAEEKARLKAACDESKRLIAAYWEKQRKEVKSQ